MSAENQTLEAVQQENESLKQQLETKQEELSTAEALVEELQAELDQSNKRNAVKSDNPIVSLGKEAKDYTGDYEIVSGAHFNGTAYSKDALAAEENKSVVIEMLQKTKGKTSVFRKIEE